MGVITWAGSEVCESTVPSSLLTYTRTQSAFTAAPANGARRPPRAASTSVRPGGALRAGALRRAGPPYAMPVAVVEYKGWKEGYRCGYCASEQGKVSAGKQEETGGN